MNYQKYIKYKNKYLQLKQKYLQVGGGKVWVEFPKHDIDPYSNEIIRRVAKGEWSFVIDDITYNILNETQGTKRRMGKPPYTDKPRDAEPTEILLIDESKIGQSIGAVARSYASSHATSAPFHTPSHTPFHTPSHPHSHAASHASSQSHVAKIGSHIYAKDGKYWGKIDEDTGLGWKYYNNLEKRIRSLSKDNEGTNWKVGPPPVVMGSKIYDMDDKYLGSVREISNSERRFHTLNAAGQFFDIGDLNKTWKVGPPPSGSESVRPSTLWSQAGISSSEAKSKRVKNIMVHDRRNKDGIDTTRLRVNPNDTEGTNLHRIRLQLCEKVDVLGKKDAYSKIRIKRYGWVKTAYLHTESRGCVFPECTSLSDSTRRRFHDRNRSSSNASEHETTQLRINPIDDISQNLVPDAVLNKCEEVKIILSGDESGTSVTSGAYTLVRIKGEGWVKTVYLHDLSHCSATPLPTLSAPLQHTWGTAKRL